MKLFFIIISALVISAFGAEAANIDDAVIKTQQDIKTALSELNTLRSEIDKARAPLAAEHNRLIEEVKRKRAIVSRAAEAKQYGEEQQHRLAAEVVQLENEIDFISGTLAEYRRGLETRISAATLQPYRGQLKLCDEALNNSSQPDAAAKTLITTALNIISNSVGGFRTGGAALNEAGIEQQGDFLFTGPLAYFSNRAGGSGIVITGPGELLPAYFEHHSQKQQQAVAALITGKTVAVPVDISSGDALRVEVAGDSFITNIRKGGFVMIPLMLIGLTGIILSVLKFYSMRNMRAASPAEVNAVVKELNANGIAAAEKAARHLPPLTASLIREALTYRKASREHLEEILHEHILAMMPQLESHLGTLAVMGAVAPLLGLLGTVTGMMHTFDLVTIFGTGEARLLSGGISEALITTKFGLGIAIPILLIHAFLARRIRTVVADLENAAVRFVNILKIEKTE